MFVEFLNQYGMQIMYAAITAIAGYIGIVVKNLATKYINDKTKEAVAKNAVKFVQQVYKDSNAEEKLTAALNAASDMLAEKGITVTELELRVLIEAAVAEFKDAFNKAETSESTEKDGE